MDKVNIKKKFSIVVAFLIIILGLGLGVYKYNKIQNYNKLITTGNKYMDSGEYDKAILLFEQSLQYKKDPNIERNIKLAKNLKEIKSIYEEGIKLLKDKKYLESIDVFKKVTKEDEKLYKNAQNEIKECKKKYIAESIELANNAAKNEKYGEANKYLDNALKIDADNREVKNLKDKFVKEVKEKKEKEQKAKAEENKQKTVNFISEEKAKNLMKDVKPVLSNGKILYGRVYYIDKLAGKFEGCTAFPDEIRGKNVYSFYEMEGENPNEVQVAEYYVDFNGHVYRNTIQSNGKCIRIK